MNINKELHIKYVQGHIFIDLCLRSSYKLRRRLQWIGETQHWTDCLLRGLLMEEWWLATDDHAELVSRQNLPLQLALFLPVIYVTIFI